MKDEPCYNSRCKLLMQAQIRLMVLPRDVADSFRNSPIAIDGPVLQIGLQWASTSQKFRRAWYGGGLK